MSTLWTKGHRTVTRLISLLVSGSFLLSPSTVSLPSLSVPKNLARFSELELRVVETKFDFRSPVLDVERVDVRDALERVLQGGSVDLASLIEVAVNHGPDLGADELATEIGIAEKARRTTSPETGRKGSRVAGWKAKATFILAGVMAWVGCVTQPYQNETVKKAAEEKDLDTLLAVAARSRNGYTPTAGDRPEALDAIYATVEKGEEKAAKEERGEKQIRMAKIAFVLDKLFELLDKLEIISTQSIDNHKVRAKIITIIGKILSLGTAKEIKYTSKPHPNTRLLVLYYQNAKNLNAKGIEEDLKAKLTAENEVLAKALNAAADGTVPFATLHRASVDLGHYEPENEVRAKVEKELNQQMAENKIEKTDENRDILISRYKDDSKKPETRVNALRCLLGYEPKDVEVLGVGLDASNRDKEFQLVAFPWMVTVPGNGPAEENYSRYKPRFVDSAFANRDSSTLEIQLLSRTFLATVALTDKEAVAKGVEKSDKVADDKKKSFDAAQELKEHLETIKDDEKTESWAIAYANASPHFIGNSTSVPQQSFAAVLLKSLEHKSKPARSATAKAIKTIYGRDNVEPTTKNEAILAVRLAMGKNPGDTASKETYESLVDVKSYPALAALAKGEKTTPEIRALMIPGEIAAALSGASPTTNVDRRKAYDDLSAWFETDPENRPIILDTAATNAFFQGQPLPEESPFSKNVFDSLVSDDPKIRRPAQKAMSAVVIQATDKSRKPVLASFNRDSMEAAEIEDLFAIVKKWDNDVAAEIYAALAKNKNKAVTERAAKELAAITKPAEKPEPPNVAEKPVKPAETPGKEPKKEPEVVGTKEDLAKELASKKGDELGEFFKDIDDFFKGPYVVEGLQAELAKRTDDKEKKALQDEIEKRSGKADPVETLKTSTDAALLDAAVAAISAEKAAEILEDLGKRLEKETDSKVLLALARAIEKSGTKDKKDYDRLLTAYKTNVSGTEQAGDFRAVAIVIKRRLPKDGGKIGLLNRVNPEDLAAFTIWENDPRRTNVNDDKALKEKLERAKAIAIERLRRAEGRIAEELAQPILQEILSDKLTVRVGDSHVERFDRANKKEALLLLAQGRSGAIDLPNKFFDFNDTQGEIDLADALIHEVAESLRSVLEPLIEPEIRARLAAQYGPDYFHQFIRIHIQGKGEGAQGILRDSTLTNRIRRILDEKVKENKYLDESPITRVIRNGETKDGAQEARAILAAAALEPGKDPAVAEAEKKKRVEDGLKAESLPVQIAAHLVLPSDYESPLAAQIEKVDSTSLIVLDSDVLNHLSSIPAGLRDGLESGRIAFSEPKIKAAELKLADKYFVSDTAGVEKKLKEAEKAGKKIDKVLFMLTPEQMQASYGQYGRADSIDGKRTFVAPLNSRHKLPVHIALANELIRADFDLTKLGDATRLLLALELDSLPVKITEMQDILNALGQIPSEITRDGKKLLQKLIDDALEKIAA